SGVILSDHLKSLDWRARKAVFASTAPATVLAEVRARAKALLGV
ncbi:MAG: mRNA-degrading endonuclease, partial [Acidimicrobiia bacterium]|nr:mRNA-degrading endonuclease [Acidimicrobiia bacterium]